MRKVLVATLRRLMVALAAIGATAAPASLLGGGAAAAATNCSATYASGGNCTTVSASKPVVVTISKTASGTSAQIEIPAGALPSGTTLSVVPVANTGSISVAIGSSSNTSTASYVAAFSITWTTPNGKTPAASKPIVLVVHNPAIKPGDVIYELVNGTLTKVGVATAAGVVTIQFTSDPVFLIMAPASGGIASVRATLSAATIGVRVSCTQGRVCAGLAYANVARKNASGGYKQVHVAAGRFSVPYGAVKTVDLKVTAIGKKILAQHHGNRFRAGVVLLFSSGTRAVHVVEAR